MFVILFIGILNFMGQLSRCKVAAISNFFLFFAEYKKAVPLCNNCVIQLMCWMQCVLSNSPAPLYSKDVSYPERLG